MSLISYAQNFEDVILSRTLRGVECGFYVDVGTADPEANSVTRAFYERGWSGINVEPLDENFVKLTTGRPRDINLKVDVGEEGGHRTLRSLALEKILEDNAWPTIHFFRIACKGAEAAVLADLNPARVRPWIIVIKAVSLDSAVSTRANWEHVVVHRGYTLAYFDGLNCFYVADEFPDLAKRLAVPPNVFDDFVKASDCANRLQIAHLHSALQKEQSETNHLLACVKQLEADLRTLRQKGGFKGLVRRVREVSDRATGGGLRKMSSRISMQMVAGISDFSRRPEVTELTQRALKPFPRLTATLIHLAEKSRAALATTPKVPSNSPATKIPAELALPASARSIHRKLQAAFSAARARSSRE